MEVENEAEIKATEDEQAFLDEDEDDEEEESTSESQQKTEDTPIKEETKTEKKSESDNDNDNDTNMNGNKKDKNNNNNNNLKGFKLWEKENELYKNKSNTVRIISLPYHVNKAVLYTKLKNYNIEPVKINLSTNYNVKLKRLQQMAFVICKNNNDANKIVNDVDLSFDKNLVSRSFLTKNGEITDYKDKTNRIFLDNISVKIDENELKLFFKENSGVDIELSDIHIKHYKIVTQREKYNGHAFINCKSNDDAMKIVNKCFMKTIKDVPIFIELVNNKEYKFDKKEHLAGDTRILVINPVHWKVTVQDLKKFIYETSEELKDKIDYVRFIATKKQFISGLVNITFKTKELCEKAFNILNNDLELNGYKFQVGYFKEKPQNEKFNKKNNYNGGSNKIIQNKKDSSVVKKMKKEFNKNRGRGRGRGNNRGNRGGNRGGGRGRGRGRGGNNNNNNNRGGGGNRGGRGRGGNNKGRGGRGGGRGRGRSRGRGDNKKTKTFA